MTSQTDAQSIQATLDEREKTHGDFTRNSIIMQGLKDLVRTQEGWMDLADYQKESIEMVCHKLGRILCGNPHFPDHWHDIAGYATLVENILLTG